MLVWENIENIKSVLWWVKMESLSSSWDIIIEQYGWRPVWGQWENYCLGGKVEIFIVEIRIDCLKWKLILFDEHGGAWINCRKAENRYFEYRKNGGLGKEEVIWMT